MTDRHVPFMRCVDHFQVPFQDRRQPVRKHRPTVPGTLAPSDRDFAPIEILILHPQ